METMLIAGMWEKDIYLRGGGYRGNQKSSERKKQSHEESHSSWDNLTKQAVMRNILKSFTIFIFCFTWGAIKNDPQEETTQNRLEISKYKKVKIVEDTLARNKAGQISDIFFSS